MRFRSKPIVALSIVLVLAGALGGWHTPDDVDDYAARTSHETQLTIQADRSAPEHCALCHWLQALSKAAPPAAQALPLDSSQFIRTGVLLERIHTTARLSVPSRAPPLA